MSKNRYKMVMLPLEKAVKGCIYHVNGKNIGICETDLNVKSINKQLEYFQPCHLYIVDTEGEASIGEFTIHNDLGIVGQVIEQFPYGQWVCKRENKFPFSGKKRNWNLLVASTDRKLDLKSIPEDMLKAYVKAPFEYVDTTKWVISAEQVEKITDELLEGNPKCGECGGETKDSTAIANQHHLDKSYLKSEVEFETKQVKCKKCTKCGHSFTCKKEEKRTLRKEAMEWWNSLPNLIRGSKHHYSDKYYPNRGHKSLTGREIEYIYSKEAKTLSNNNEEDVLKAIKGWWSRLNEDRKKDLNYKHFKNRVNFSLLSNQEIQTIYKAEITNNKKVINLLRAAYQLPLKEIIIRRGELPLFEALIDRLSWEENYFSFIRYHKEEDGLIHIWKDWYFRV